MIRRPLLNATAVEGGGAANPAASPAPSAPPPIAGGPTQPQAPPATPGALDRLKALFNPSAQTNEIANLRAEVARLTARNAELEPIAAEHKTMVETIAQLEGSAKTQARAVATQVAQLGYQSPADVPSNQPRGSNEPQTLEEVQAAIKATKDPVELGRLTAKSRALRNPDLSRN
ncbi:MAG: hypothetical protein JSR82_24470 [Verrucomicrobia bacterium]|nr:hypothetical protein [Verrucomicrobiota bacterium]